MNIQILIALLVIFASIGVAFVGWYVVDFILLLPKLKKLVADADKPVYGKSPIEQLLPLQDALNGYQPTELTPEQRAEQHKALLSAVEKLAPPKQQTPTERLAEIRQRRAILEGTSETPVYLDALDEIRQLNEEEARISEQNNIFS